MKTVKIAAYKFEELDGRAKEKARNWITDRPYDWWDYIEDDIKQTMDKRGFSVEKMYFQASFTQGDYVSLEGEIYDGILFLKTMGNDEATEIARALEDNNHVYGLGFGIDAQSLYVYGDYDIYIDSYIDEINSDLSLQAAQDHAENMIKGIDRMIESARECVKENLEQINQEVLKRLYEDIQYSYSDAYCKDTADANGYLFDSNGNPVHQLIEKKMYTLTETHLSSTEITHREVHEFSKEEIASEYNVYAPLFSDAIRTEMRKGRLIYMSIGIENVHYCVNGPSQ